MSQDEKDRSHARIVANAARLMRQHGTAGASVKDVMEAAGMTHGGFYKHFDTKEALLAAALDEAFGDIVKAFGTEAPLGDTAAAATRFKDFYLSDGHSSSPGVGCPIPALGGDVSRGDATLKARFGAGIRQVTALLARGTRGSERVRQRRATRELAMMAGAIMIARASDPATAQAVLSACRGEAP